EVEFFFIVEFHWSVGFSAKYLRNLNSLIRRLRVVRLRRLQKKLCGRVPTSEMHTLQRSWTCKTSWRWSVITVIDGIDAAHRSLADLFLDYMRHETGRTRDHENAVERGGVHSEIGEDRADGAVYVDGERFFRGGERFLDRPRRLHVHAVQTGLASKLEQTRRARIFGVQTVTKSRHAFARFTHSRERARSGFIHRNRFARGTLGNCFELPGAIFNS